MLKKNLLKIGVIGSGHMGKYHINVLNTFNHINFIGIFDKNKKEALKISQEYKIKSFSSFNEILDNVDAVVLATPTSTHYQLGKEILSRGRHLLIEKPITNNLDLARELVELAEKKKVKFLIGHVERYNAAVQELNKLVKKPYLWESRRVGPSTRNRTIDIGVVLDLLIHDIDILLRVVKKKIIDFSAHGHKVFSNFEDVVQASIKFEGGCIANLIVSRIHHLKERSLQISQEGFTLVLDFTTQDISIFRKGQSQVTTQKSGIKYQQQSSVERMFIHKENPLKLELEFFVNLIEKNLPNDNNLDLKTLEISLEIIKQVFKHEK